jgi:hypothetical protein
LDKREGAGLATGLFVLPPLLYENIPWDTIPIASRLCYIPGVATVWRAVVHLFSDAEAMRIERGEKLL